MWLYLIIFVIILLIPFPWGGWNCKWYRNYDRLHELYIKKSHQWVGVPLNKEQCYKNLKLVDQIFKKHGIKYWITEGTALGMIRDGDFIRWDDDVDIGVDIKYLKKFLEILPELDINGFTLTRVEMDGSFYCLIRDDEKVDIDFIGKGLACASAEYTCPGNKCPCDNIMPYLKDKKIQYRDLILTTPEEGYLELVYGDWRTPKRSKHRISF